jgi:hypothetical protein
MNAVIVQPQLDAKELSEAYMQTYRDFKALAEKERDIISRLREAERLVRQIRNEERELEVSRWQLSTQAKEQEATLKERGLTDFDLTILRKRTEPQPELPKWLME